MAADGEPAGGALPAALPLLLFHAAGMALGVETVAVEGVVDAEGARQSGIASRDLAELLGLAGAPAPASNMRLLLKGRDARCALAIDSLDEIVAIPTAALQPLPELLAHFRRPRAFWGGLVRGDKIVLLVDVDRLQQAAPAMQEILWRFDGKPMKGQAGQRDPGQQRTFSADCP